MGRQTQRRLKRRLLWLAGLVTAVMLVPFFVWSSSKVLVASNLTLVMVNRNDDYAMLGRERAIRVMNHFVGKYNVTVELLVVEWNLLPNLPPLADTMLIPGNFSSVRFIRAPSSLHERWVHENNLYPNLIAPPVLEFIAKNIGICRARNKWIMGHAIDTMMTEPFWKWLSRGGQMGCRPILNGR